MTMKWMINKDHELVLTCHYVLFGSVCGRHGALFLQKSQSIGNYLSVHIAHLTLHEFWEDLGHETIVLFSKYSWIPNSHSRNV